MDECIWIPTPEWLPVDGGPITFDGPLRVRPGVYTVHTVSGRSYDLEPNRVVVCTSDHLHVLSMRFKCFAAAREVADRG